MRDELQKLQKQVSQFLEKSDYVNSLMQWRLLHQSLKDLSADTLVHHIQQGHQLVAYFLANKQSDEADKLYQQLKAACFDLSDFSSVQKIEFCITAANAYANHGLWDKAREYASYGLWLSECKQLPQYQQDLKQLLTRLLIELQFFWTQPLWQEELDKIAQSQNLHTDLQSFLSRLTPSVMLCLSRNIKKPLEIFYQQVAPVLTLFQDWAASSLHVSKQKSLEEFNGIVKQLLPIAALLTQHHQWQSALAIYGLIIGHAEREAAGFDKHIVINNITQLNDYLLNPVFVSPVTIKPDWQQWREELQEFRGKFQLELNTSKNIMELQQSFSRELKKLLSEILKTIEVSLGKPPCAFSFVALGSLAREDACPYSDVDFALLVSDESKRHDEYFQALINLFSLAINLIGEPNGLAIDSGDLGYLTGKDKICLNTPVNLARRFSPSKYQEILNQPETHALHRPGLLYASIGGENLLTDYQQKLQSEWEAYRSQWVSGYARLHYDAWQVLGKKANVKNRSTTIDLKEDYLRPLLLWLSDVALQAGIEVVSIPDLLREFGAKQVLDSDFLKELTAALETIQKLRIELQLNSHSQEEKLDVLKNISAGLVLERIRSQVLVPAYESVLQFEKQSEKQLKQFDPVTEHLLQAISSPPTAGIPVGSISSSSSSTSSTSSVSFFKPASPLMVEQAIQTFIEVMLQRGGKPNEQRNKHRAIYGKLSSKLRAFYLKQLEAESAEGVQTKKLDQKTADTILQALCRYPDSSGMRKSSTSEMASWETTLLSLTEASNQASQTMSVTFEWFNSRGQKERRVLKPYYVEQVWGTQGKLGAHDKLSDGRRLVRPLQDPSGKLVAYIKVYPELPGIQLSVNSLVQHISGEGMKSTVVKATVVSPSSKSPTTYPLLLSEPVSGKTLQQVLREQGNLNEIEKKIDSKSFTLKVFEDLLVYPEDSKGDNLVAEQVVDLENNRHYRILSIDSDHAYVAPLVQTGTLVNRQEKVQVKSLLYCMDAMLQPLNPEAIEEFLLLDPYQVLNDWLSGLHVYNQRYIGNRELNVGGLFTDAEIQQYAEGKDFCFVQIFFEPGWIVGMYERFLRLQAALRDNPLNNHLELLTLIEPRLAIYYEEAFAKHKTAHERFQSLPTEYVSITEKQTSTVRYQSTLKTREKVLKSITIMDQKKKKDLKVALREGSLFTPEKAQKMELQVTHERYQRIQDIRAQIIQGSLDAFTQIEYGDFFKQKVINSLDFGSSPLQNPVFVKALLQSLEGVSFFSLSLQGCFYLNDELLLAIIKGSPNLRELDVSNCNQLAETSFYAIPRYCKHLVKLTMSNTSLITIEPGLTRSVQFSSLRRLRLQNCEKLTELTIDTPELEELHVNECQNLSRLSFKGLPPKFLNIENCKQLETQKNKAAEELINAVRQNNLGKVQSVLSNHAYCINEINKDGWTPLCIAAQAEKVEALQLLLKVGAKVDQAMSDGRTPLCIAAREGKVETLQALLQAGAKVDQATSNGKTPLYIAAGKGHVEILEVLLKAGAKVDQANNDGKTPLYIAVFKGKVEALQLLIKVGAAVDQGNNNGATALFNVAQEGKAEVLQLLLKAGAKVDQTDNNGATPLFFAVGGGKIDALQLLLKAGAKVDQANNNGRTPLCIAVQEGKAEASQLLLKAGAKVDQTDNNGVTPLFFAVKGGKVDALQLLLKAGAKVDQAMSDGSIPLYIAAQNGRVDVIKILLAYRANSNHKTPFSAALQIATANNHTAVIALLNDYLKNPLVKQQEYRHEVDEHANALIARIDKTLLESEQRVNEIIKKVGSSTSSSSSVSSYSAVNLITQYSPIISTPAVSSSIPLIENTTAIDDDNEYEAAYTQ